MHEMPIIATGILYQSVNLSVTIKHLRPAKTAEQIEVLFGAQALGAQEKL